MTTSMSIRDLTRSGSVLFEYDYIDIEDKKANEYKGVFIPKQFADDVKAFLNEKLTHKRTANVEAIMKFNGILNGETSNSSIQELKATKK